MTILTALTDAAKNAVGNKMSGAVELAMNSAGKIVTDMLSDQKNPHSPSSGEKKPYVLQLAKAIAADNVIGTEELRRIYKVMVDFEVGADVRSEILEMLFFDHGKLASLELEASFVENDVLRMALAKDLLFVQSQEDNTATEQVAQSILDKLGINPAQIEVLGQWVAWENKALRQLGAEETDLADEKSHKEILSRLATVGVPLAALYSAGTVGFSAIGITSGLATIGSMSGLAILHLNPMTAGIAALILAGVSVKKLCDVTLKSGQKKEIEAALAHAKELQERYQSYLGLDMIKLEERVIGRQFASKDVERKQAVDAYRFLLLGTA